MDNLKSVITNAVAIIPGTENQKGIENHKKIARHYQAASKYHLQSAKHHEAGNHQKAEETTMAAYGHVSIAENAQRKDVRHHVKNGLDGSQY
ncbi:MAG: hypothetical protein ACI86M_000641 [Saprospiraceae bacterium]|jgi:hypothetical protein